MKKINSWNKEQITQGSKVFSLRFCSKEVLRRSRSHARVKLHLFLVFETFEKFKDSEVMSTNPAARKTGNNLKYSTSRLISNEVSLINANSHLMVQLF